MGTSDIWFQSMTTPEQANTTVTEKESEEDRASDSSQPPQKRHIEKSFFFSVEDVQYNRDVSPMLPFPNNSAGMAAAATSAATGTSGQSNTASTSSAGGGPTVEKSTPTHILTVTGAKGAWTQSNRDMAFSLYDSW